MPQCPIAGDATAARYTRVLKYDSRMGGCYAAWHWQYHHAERMINKLASTFQVQRHVQCMANCSVSPVCDSYNYRPTDNTCELNTHDTPMVANSADMVSDSAWTWGRPIFCNVV